MNSGLPELRDDDMKVATGQTRPIQLQGQQELSTESVYLTQPPRAILGMVGDGAMTLSTVYNFCFETNNYYQDKKIIYIVSRARVGDPLML